MIIDRFEGENAIVHDGDEIICIHRSHLPSGAGAGDFITLSGGRYQLDRSNDLESEVRSKLKEMLGGTND